MNVITARTGAAIPPHTAPRMIRTMNGRRDRDSTAKSTRPKPIADSARPNAASGRKAAARPVCGRSASAFSKPRWEPDPDRDHPYTRRTMLLNEHVYPGDHAQRLWPITVDNLPEAGTYYPVQFRYDGDVSDPPLYDSAVSDRIWIIRE
ncbi:hypothetical protein [Microbacterium radiodurans]|uniref:Uncharacterized protein n=1 Tax=Microbacterium radiodurans TaxID=661398 RepID=A0A5J5INL0_9MICO|nr:hypothetical protein [Microbacterium radiodurans]KAA9083735.1 hypothetical protein F6B42_14380 [Microbacterium radiodurans]